MCHPQEPLNLGIRRAKQNGGLLRLAVWLCLSACMALIFFSGCSGTEPMIASLLDQISDDECAGPWRILLCEDDVRDLAANSAGLCLREERLFQVGEVSSYRTDLPLHGGELVVVWIAYAKDWGGEGAVEGAVEARLLRHGDVVISSKIPLKSHSVELTLRSPASGADCLEIRHILETGGHIPLKRLRAVAVAQDASAGDIERARILLPWAVGSTWGPLGILTDGLQYKKFPVSMNGSTRDAVAILGGDTLVFSVPFRSPKLRFWVAPLRVRTPSSALLRLQALSGERWEDIAHWDDRAVKPKKWRRIDLTLSPREEYSKLRFVLSGLEDIMALAEPILLPDQHAVSRKMNLILVVLDTMRADRLASYGYNERPTSQGLDSLLEAKGFFVFKNAYSSAPWTAPAIAKFFTSRYLNIDEHRRFPRRYTTLAEILRRQGYYSIAFTGGGFLRIPGFEQGFLEYYWVENRGKIEDTFPGAMTWLKEDSIQPFFLFLHTYEPHMPYTRDIFCRGLPRGRLGDLSRGESLLPDGMSNCSRLTRQESLYVEAAYDGGVRNACDATAHLCHLLDQLDLWENTVVVVLSDHGEEFWDHFPVFAEHGRSLYGEMLDVPFMIYAPHMQKGRIHFIEDEVSTVDLLPTVVDLLGLSLEEEYDGVSLRPAMNGETLLRTVPILATDRSTKTKRVARTCVFSDGKKYIEPSPETVDYTWAHRPCCDYPPERELYILGEDPKEAKNLVGQAPQLTKQMTAKLHQALQLALKREPGSRDEAIGEGMTRDLERQLQTLGYMSP